MQTNADPELYAKRLLEQYRARAEFVYGGGQFVKVSPQANVQPMEDGAFVELQVWIPRADLPKAGES